MLARGSFLSLIGARNTPPPLNFAIIENMSYL